MKKVAALHLLLLTLIAGAVLAEAVEPATGGCEPELVPSAMPTETVPMTLASGTPELAAGALLAGGLQELEAEPQSTSLPPCPLPYGCGGTPYVVCLNTNCSTSDTGDSACQLGNVAFICPPGETIHVRNCGCRKALQAQCCVSPPYCDCTCNWGSRSVFCQ